MGDVTVCWAPECGQVPEPSKGRPRKYCNAVHKMRAVRRNGGKAPTEPYPPFEPTPLQQDAAPVTVVAPPETGPVTPPSAPTRRKAAPPPAPAKSKGGPRGKSAAPPSAPVAADKPMQRPDGVEVRTPPAATVTQLHVAVTEDATVPVVITVHPMVARYRADLEAMGQSETRQGLQVLAMAEKLVSSATSPAAAANLSKELNRLMEALEQTTPAALADRDPSTVIRERTLAKLRLVAG